MKELITHIGDLFQIYIWNPLIYLFYSITSYFEPSIKANRFSGGHLTTQGRILVKCDSYATEVVVPEGVVCIGPNAFTNHDKSQSKLSLILPKSLQYIHPLAFNGCKQIRTITLHKETGVIDLKPLIVVQGGYYITISIKQANFLGYASDCRTLCNLPKQIESNKQVFTLDVSEYQEYTLKISLRYQATTDNSTSLSLKHYADYSSDREKIPFENITKILIEDNRVEIGNNQFSGLKKLEAVSPNNLNSISSRAFNECSKLKKFDLSNIKHIGDESFKGCSEFNPILTYPGLVHETSFNGCQSVIIVNPSQHSIIPSSKDMPISKCISTEQLGFTHISKHELKDIILDTLAKLIPKYKNKLRFMVGSSIFDNTANDYSDDKVYIPSLKALSMFRLAAHTINKLPLPPSIIESQKIYLSLAETEEAILGIIRKKD